MSRPSRDEMFLRIALIASRRSTCKRREVGCVLVNKDHHIIAIGYNGVPRNRTHCTDEPCPGAALKSGTGLDLCEAVHAEQNALLQCNPQEVDVAYVTASPCVHCVKMLLNTPCHRISFIEEYPHPVAKQLWMSTPIIKYPPSTTTIARFQRSWERIEV